MALLCQVEYIPSQVKDTDRFPHPKGFGKATPLQLLAETYRQIKRVYTEC